MIYYLIIYLLFIILLHNFLSLLHNHLSYGYTSGIINSINNSYFLILLNILSHIIITIFIYIKIIKRLGFTIVRKIRILRILRRIIIN
jgi:hypothetical protein